MNEDIVARLCALETKIDKLTSLIENQSTGVQAMEDHIDLVEAYVRIIPTPKMLASVFTKLNPMKLIQNTAT